jgi:hypothetical protein
MTWGTGTIVKAPYLRHDVTNAVGFLAQRPFFIGKVATATAWPNGTDAAMALTQEVTDTWNGHNPLINTAQYFAQAPGWYLSQVTVPYSYTGTTPVLFTAGFNFTYNGVSTGPVRGPVTIGGVGTFHNYAVRVWDLIPQIRTGAIGSADYIQFTTGQFSTGALSFIFNPQQYAYASVRWVAALSGTATLPVPANATWPVPPSIVTSTFMNTNVRDTINFLTYPPVCKANYVAGAAALINQTFPAAQAIELNNVVVDNYGGFTTGTAAFYTTPRTGNYFCYGQVNLAATTATTNYCAGFSIAGGTTQWGDSLRVTGSADATGAGMCVAKRLRLTSGQTIQLMASQNSGASVNYAANAVDETRMIVVWEGS